MRKTIQTALCGIILHVATLLVAGPVTAGDCEAKAVAVLKTASPNGYGIFQRTKDKAFFRTWLDCSDAQFRLPTAVHESVHLLTGDSDAYPLIGGGSVKRPPDANILFAPGRIARQFRPSIFVTTYLRPGGATSAADFRYLLDELNAYTASPH